MDIANSLLGLVNNLWGLASRPLGYTCNLKDNVRSLEKEKDDLKDVSEDVKTRVQRAEEGGGAQRTRQVEKWLGKAQEFEVGVDPVLREAGENDQIKCLSRCLPWNCRSSYRLGKRVDQMLKEARELQQKKGEFSDFTSPLPPPPVLQLPMGETVGLDISLNKVLKWLVDEKQVAPIGLYGTGGVGKTTLMKRLNKELSHANHGFDIVIWVVVSKQVNEDSIQDAIRKRLHIQDESWNGWIPDERIHHLYDALTRKKFVLLIDDVWRRLDLSNIGVPPGGLENGSKVVFTTRLKDVCRQMKANKTLEVQCLTREEALKLFEKNVGKSLVDCHQEIHDLAKDIVEECKGLPLALITVGRAMAPKDNPREWRHVLTMLRNSPHKLSGMEEEVYHILELSYNSLNDSTRKACFLYCCLFPEDYLIRTDELIELWIGEGLLRDTDDVYRMRDEGESILGELKRACLLESEHVDYEERECVKMHDVIRDMATWIARDRGQKENKLLVIEKEEDISTEMISKWGETEKASLWGQWIQNMDRTPPHCSKLKTLFIRETCVTGIPRGFFHSMGPCLTLLDLSDNRGIELFPEGICDLINLQYLNLSGTSIQELPKEIKKLTRLQCLLLDDIGPGILIPTGAITSLPLNVFSYWDSHPSSASKFLVNEEEVVEELGRMQHLTNLSIKVFKSSSTPKIFQSSNISKCIRRAWIDNDQNDLISILMSYSLAGSSNFSHLEVLYLTRCKVLREVEIAQGIGQAPVSSCFPNLIEVWVMECGLPNLSWFMHAPKLRKLMVGGCSSMEKIIGDGFTREELVTSGLFSRLEHLTLTRLPKLISICDHALSFPTRASFRIFDCPRLRKLPLHSNDARGSFKFTVEGGNDWWAEFEWDPAARITFQQFDRSLAEEMTFEEAVRKMKDERIPRATIGFGPIGSGTTE